HNEKSNLLGPATTLALEGSNMRTLTNNFWFGLLAVSLAWLLCGSSFAATYTGKVTDDRGGAIWGAMVTLKDDDGLGQSVFTNKQGEYLLQTERSGELQLRFRKRYHDDKLLDLNVQTGKQETVDAILPQLTDAKAISDDHPSLSHFSMIAFDSDESEPFSRSNFARDCLSCHQLGNEFTRYPRSPEGWMPTVQRMHGYWANADEDSIKHRSKMLSDAFDGKKLATSKPHIPFDEMVENAKIYQWPLPDAVVPHDAEYHPENGKVYISEMFAGEVIEADLKTNEVKHFELPAEGMPPGGAFTKRGLPSPYGLTISRAPHSLAEGPDGKFYLTDSIGSAITVFDPKDASFKSHDIGGDVLYPHTVRAAKDGIIWFSIAFSDQIGRFDPATGKTKVLSLPKSPTFGAAGTTVPYGMAVSPVDGNVWYTKLASDKIGRIDAKTLEIKEFDSPVLGPRRHRFDAAGYLWIAGFSSGDIARVDIQTMDAKVYELPRYAPGEIPAPYALAVNPYTQDIWVNDTMVDVSWRFIREEERFVAYPMPLKGTYTRDFTFTKEGWACSSNNPIPASALEGGVPELLCIDPGEPMPAGAKVASH
ncbi:MAG: carboxypeptidase regulatory-like domain-containing protein, partial [Pseudomonadota bacterium]